MRPNKIVMTAFGPYAGTTVVDFDALGEKGLYLITGNTGAGKTTIFDGVCFALFGEASGKNRDSSMFRSKFAKDGTPTEVELTFSDKGKTYIVKRNPEYMKISERKKGSSVKCVANASLQIVGSSEPAITKIKDVNEKIHEILGIDYNQFTQIAMLAQGAFLEMLYCDTQRRITIFRNIFETGNYEIFAEKLKKTAIELYSEIKNDKTKIGAHVSNVRCAENSVFSLDIDRARAGELSTEDVMELLSKIISQDGEKFDQLEKEIIQIDEALESINRKIDAAEKLIIEIENLKKTTESRKLLESQQNEVEKILAEAHSQDENIKKWRDEAIRIEAKLPQYDELLEQRKIAKNCEINIEKNTKEIETLDISLKEKDDEIAGLKKEAESLEDTSAEIARFEAGIAGLNVAYSEVEAIKDKLNQYFELKSELKTLQESFLSAEKAYKTAEQEFTHANDAYLKEQAGILAADLEEGEPCPVCGSTTHPRLATISEGAPTKETVEKLKKARDNADVLKVQCSEKASACKGKVETAGENIEKSLMALLDTKDISVDEASELLASKATEISLEKNEKAILLENANKKDKRRGEIATLIPQREEEKQQISQQINELNITKTQLKNDHSHAKTRADELKGTLEFATRDEAISKKQEYENRAKEAEAAINLAKARFDEIKSKIDELNGTIAKTKETISTLPEADIEQENHRKTEILSKKGEFSSARDEIVSRIDINKNALREISAIAEGIIDKENRYTMINSMAATAKGELSGKEKINLETYVQTFYFDRVLNRANKRFLAMTDGHYELKRGSADNNRSKAGLDISVMDYYNGSERSVKSLSGGESFEAALALALGLADEIEATAGGIHLDVLFVDEGFGSLDEDSLDKAMKALRDLSEDNRLVGIISHVAELKKRIDKQIVVTKKKTGESEIEIIAGLKS